MNYLPLNWITFRSYGFCLAKTIILHHWTYPIAPNLTGSNTIRKNRATSPRFYLPEGSRLDVTLSTQPILARRTIFQQAEKSSANTEIRKNSDRKTIWSLYFFVRGLRNGMINYLETMFWGMILTLQDGFRVENKVEREWWEFVWTNILCVQGKFAPGIVRTAVEVTILSSPKNKISTTTRTFSSGYCGITVFFVTVDTDNVLLTVRLRSWYYLKKASPIKVHLVGW